MMALCCNHHHHHHHWCLAENPNEQINNNQPNNHLNMFISKKNNEISIVATMAMLLVYFDLK